MGKILEGRWDCSYCGTKGILGRHRECPNCGRPRGEDVKFYLPSSKDYVPDEETQKIGRKPDWLCGYCGSYNPDTSKICKSCGAKRSENEKDYFDVQKQKRTLNNQEQEKEQFQKKLNIDESTQYEELRNEPENNVYNLKINNHIKCAIAILLSIILIFGLVSIFTPKNTTMEVTGFSWQRTIEIEQYRTFHENDWSVPDGGRITSQKSEIHHYDKVLDHYETKTRQVTKQRISGYETYTTTKDLGNGYFEEETHERPIYETYYENETYEEPVYRDVPVYWTKYYYDIERWVYERSVTTSQNDQSPYWGETNLQSDERISKKNEEYVLIGITSYKKEQVRNIVLNDMQKWSEFEIGQKVKVKVYVGGITKLDE